jgi:hypothetical protein
MLHGCPHVGQGFCGHVLHGFAHVLHGFAHVPHSANAGTENITATATTNTNAANFFIATPPCYPKFDKANFGFFTSALSRFCSVKIWMLVTIISMIYYTPLPEKRQAFSWKDASSCIIRT